jgi:hypothetical protein
MEEEFPVTSTMALQMAQPFVKHGSLSRLIASTLPSLSSINRDGLCLPIVNMK